MRAAAASAPLRSLARITVVVTAVALLAGVLLLAPEVRASTPDLTRIAGEDRFETAAAAAAVTNPDGADAVIIAAGYNFPDSLAAAGLSGLRGAPILLVNDVAGTVPAATNDALAELEPDTLYIAGGPGAIGDAIIADLEGGGWALERLSGEDRFATAALMAAEFAPDDVGDGTAIVATGRTAADALSAGPLAASGPHPILLTEVDELPEATAAALDGLAVEQVLVLGGAGAVSADVVDEIEAVTGSGSVTRLAGDDRFATAVEIAEASPELAASNEILVATGYGSPNPAGVDVPADALVAALYGGQTASPLLPVNDARDELPEAIRAYTAGKALQITAVTVFGGSGAVSDALAGEVTGAATSDAEGPAVLFDDAVVFTDALDEAVTLTVTVVDDDGAAVADQEVALELDREGDDGATDTDATTVTTDAAGRASWSVDAPGEIAEDLVTATADTEFGELTADARVVWSTAAADNHDAAGDGLLAYADSTLLTRDGWSGDPANDAIAAADDGDTLELLGTHDYFAADDVIDANRPVTLTGDATIHGTGFSAITITSPGVALAGLEVRHSGDGVPHAVLVEVDADDAGIVIDGIAVVEEGSGDTSGITVTNDGGELSGVTIRNSSSTGFATPVFVTQIDSLPREPMTPFGIGGAITDVVIEDNVLSGGGQAILAGLFDEDNEDTPDVTITGNTLTPANIGVFLNGRVDPDQVTDNVFQGAAGRHVVVRGSADDAAAEQLARDLVPRNEFPATEVFHLGHEGLGLPEGVEGWVVGAAP